MSRSSLVQCNAMNVRWQGRAFSSLRSFARRPAVEFPRHGLSTKPSELTPESSQKARARLEHINSRLPRFLRGYTTPLVNAPISHISAFLLLHELTAVIPLFALAGTFHYTQWLPSVAGEWKWVADGAEKFGRYFKRKGWLLDEEEVQHKGWSRGESGTRVVLEYATGSLSSI